MTCIVGVVDESRIWIGADAASADTDQWFVTEARQPKVFAKDSIAFGFTTSWRMGQLIQHRLRLPAPDPVRPLEEWMVSTFVDELRKALLDGGYAKKEHNVEVGGTFLVGLQGRLFTIQTDFAVVEHAKPYAAIGCGNNFAYGALHATQGLSLTPPDRIIIALRAAAEFSAYVRPPFTVITDK